jgi:ComF family protein
MKVDNWLKNSLIVPHCTLCLAPTTAKALCDGCYDDLPWLDNKRCSLCALPIETTDAICGNCLQTPPAFDECQALFKYQSPIDGLISQFKYQADLATGALLSSMLVSHLSSTTLSTIPDVLIPMPLHTSRLQERGFNQAAIFASALSAHFDIPVNHHLCKRVRATGHQMGLNASTRKSNLHRAFECTNSVANKSIAIIDDVVTTGTTVNELASTLRKHGASHIQIWCLARTPSPA